MKRRQRVDAQAPQAAVAYTSLNEQGRSSWGKAYSTLGTGLLSSKQALSPLILIIIHTDQTKILLLPSPIPPQPRRQLSVQARRRPRPIHTLLSLLIYLLRIQPPPNLTLTLGHPCSKSQSPLRHVYGPKKTKANTRRI